MRLVLACLAVVLVPFSAWAIPPIQQATLANGMNVLLMEAHDVPMVAMQLTLPAGSRFDPPLKGGAAALLAAMLTDHTARHEHDAWAGFLDQHALRLGSDVDKDAMHISLTVLRESLNEGMGALSEALLHPGWNEKRFSILRQDAIFAARKALEEPGVVASVAAHGMLYGDHPYGHRSEGSPDSLQRINMADLQSIYRRQAKPEGAVLAVSGDITMPELLRLVRQHLGSWAGRPSIGRQDIANPRPVRGQQSILDMPTTQTLIQFVRLGPARNAPDFFPVFVLNHMLGGGGFGSRLMEEVREKRGLVYGIYSYFVPLTVSGPFTIMLQTRADQADEAEHIVRQVMQTFASGRISQRMLDAAKMHLVGSFAQRMDSNRERVALMSMIGFYGLPLDYLQTWSEHVRAVTLQQVRQEAMRWLKFDDWNVIRVGPIKR
ncbi:MAG: insulinase family protein [Zetaproteobacteria bacterium]|nr:MAG: insulinase family protein [Zetaproteobacteria bacterium]